MARKKSVVQKPESKLTAKEQLDWFVVHKGKELYIEIPANISILDIFVMLDDVPLTFRSIDDRLETHAGIYKRFLMDDNPALFNYLAANAASIL